MRHRPHKLQIACKESYSEPQKPCQPDYRWLSPLQAGLLPTDNQAPPPPLSYIVYLKDGTYVYIDCTEIIEERGRVGSDLVN